VLLIDFGGGTTDIALFADGAIRMTGGIDLGGDIVTSDITKLCNCSPYDAENMKKKYGAAIPAQVDSEEMVELPSVHRNRRRPKQKRRFLAEIIEARVEEILLQVRGLVERSPYRDRLLAGVVITGGSALLDGMTELTERVFGMPVRVGYPQDVRGMSGVVSSPIYSTAVGLVCYGLDEIGNNNGHRRASVGRLYEWVLNTYC